jgi:release factor glutamine methyltransferase
MTAGAAALAWATERLRTAGVPAPAREARLLLAHAQDRPGGVPDLARGAPAVFSALIERRAAREPMALLTGVQGFWTLDLEVSPDTLIPRADSETLIEALLAACPDRAAPRRFLDLGTGTGALLLAALCEFPAAFGVGIDRSIGAARLAGRNAGRCGLAQRCAWVVGDWGRCLGAAAFDAVLSNPPYIPSVDVDGLMPEVSRHEPRAALDGGAEGLDAYRAIVPELPRLLRPGGLAVLEVGQGQADAVCAMGLACGLRVQAVRPDLAGVDRAVALRLGGDAK